MKNRIGQTVAFGMALLLIFSACNGSGLEQQPTHSAIVAVDPLLREAYQTLGGEMLFGPALTGLFHYHNYDCQYLEAGMLCYDPLDANRFKFMPLGIALNVQDAPDAPAGGQGLVVDGYTIYPAFVPLYQSLQGARYVGKPLTQPRFDYRKQRVEQYFENLGFYQLMNDAQGEVHLLAYGVFACDTYCRYSARSGSEVIASQGSEDEIFLAGMNAFGLDILGVPLTRPMVGPDGLLQQVYDGAVVYSPTGDPNQVALRPIARWLGMPSDPPQSPGMNAHMVFYPTQGELGYYVPVEFDQFLAQHGGVAFSGLPISSVVTLDHFEYRQCFENYCLVYNGRGAPALRVRFMALGVTYLQQFPAPPEVLLRPLYSPDMVLLTVSEEKPRISAGEVQVIYVQVAQRSGLQPIAGVGGTLTVSTTDGRQFSLPLPLTDAQGAAQLMIEPMTGAPNSTIVHYQVCLNLPSPEPICTWEDYYIWNYK